MTQTLTALLSNPEARQKTFVTASLSGEFVAGKAWWGKKAD